MGVVAVRGDHTIGGLYGRLSACYQGFLTDVEVTKPPDFLLYVQVSGFLFEAAHQQHRLIPLKVCFAAKFTFRHILQ
jgi:hypothetical protein